MLTNVLRTKLPVRPARFDRPRKYSEILSDPVSPKVKDLRKGVNRLLLKVHPDFFRDSPKVAKVNEASLSQLNAFIDVVEQNSKQKFFRLIKTRVSDVFSVKFYLKFDKGYETIKCDYRFPPHFFISDVHVSELENEAVIYINHLLTQAGLETVMLSYSEEDRKKPLPDEDEFGEPVDHRTPREKMLVSLIERVIVKENPYRKSMLRQMDPEHNLVFWKFRRVDDTLKTGDVMKEEDSIYMDYDRQIFYAPSLTPAQRSRAYRDFMAAKDELDHHLWADLPILFTSGTYLPSFVLAGFITIPFDFEVRSLVEYIHRCLPEIRYQRRTIRAQILQVRFLQQQVTLALGLKKITYRGTRQQCIDCLSSLCISEELELIYLRDFTLRLDIQCDEPAIDFKEDIMTIPIHFNGYEFLEFLKSHAQALEDRQKAMELMEEHRLKLLEFAMTLKFLIGCKEILIGHRLAKNYFYQFVGMVNLKQHVEFLRSLNMRDFTIVLSDSFRMDARHMTIDFPFNFTKERYLAFYEKVQHALSKRPAKGVNEQSNGAEISAQDTLDANLSPTNSNVSDNASISSAGSVSQAAASRE